MSACGPLLYESGHVAHDAHTGVLTVAPGAWHQEMTGEIPAHPSHRVLCGCKEECHHAAVQGYRRISNTHRTEAERSTLHGML